MFLPRQDRSGSLQNGLSQLICRDSPQQRRKKRLQHAVLQNRAAIDILLLSHGHGCEEFEGLCCMDLNDHSRSIHAEIQQLINHSQKIKEDKGFFGLDGLVSELGLGGWIKSMVKTLFLLLIMVLVGLVLLSCAITCVKRIMFKATTLSMISHKENRGGVVSLSEEWLCSRGHDKIEPCRM